MKVKVDGPAGVEELELELDLNELTMRESVRLEEILGTKLFDRVMSQQLTEQEMGRPSFIRAMLFVKLKTLRPDLEIDSFDVDLGEFSAALETLTQGADSPKVGEPLSE